MSDLDCALSSIQYANNLRREERILVLTQARDFLNRDIARERARIRADAKRAAAEYRFIDSLRLRYCNRCGMYKGQSAFPADANGLCGKCAHALSREPTIAAADARDAVKCEKYPRHKQTFGVDRLDLLG